MHTVLPALYILAPVIGAMAFVWTQNRTADRVLRWGSVIFGVAMGLVMAMETHCAGGLLKGLDPCPAGPWLNDLARGVDDVVLPLALLSVVAVPAVLLIGFGLELRHRLALQH